MHRVVNAFIDSYTIKNYEAVYATSGSNVQQAFYKHGIILKVFHINFQKDVLVRKVSILLSYSFLLNLYN